MLLSCSLIFFICHLHVCISMYLILFLVIYVFIILNIILSQAEIARQEARLKMEKENLEKEKSVLMGTASNQDNQDGALEITVSGEKYRCLRFSKAKKWGFKRKDCDVLKYLPVHFECFICFHSSKQYMSTSHCNKIDLPLLVLFDLMNRGVLVIHGRKKQ